jgi:hypothetical protein
MKHLGRIIARKEVAGIFIPMSNKTMSGIYDVIEIDGEFILKPLGKSCLQEEHEARFNALDADGLMNERPYSMMTTKELKATGQY